MIRSSVELARLAAIIVSRDLRHRNETQIALTVSMQGPTGDAGVSGPAGEPVSVSRLTFLVLLFSLGSIEGPQNFRCKIR